MIKERTDLMICRCEEVTDSEILEAIRNGAESVNDIKRRTRAGMGLCQGRTCRRLVSQILASTKKKPLKDVLPSTFRSPVRPLKLSALAGETSALQKDESKRKEK